MPAKDKTQTTAIREDWLKLGILEQEIVEDFISVLPRYEWTAGKWEEENIRIQAHNGYRMQSNLYVAVDDEASAMRAIDAAFRHGLAEVVTFDYWTADLTEQKQKAMKAALKQAQEKADILLSVFGDEPPPIINIQEQKQVVFPRSLYHTYENVLEEDFLGRYWEERARIKAYRPKMTFYQGVISQVDGIPAELPLRPEISIVSQVLIYYKSPVGKVSTAAE